MNWKESFPSKYVQAADLNTPLIVTITHVSMENVGKESASEFKPVAYFREIRKGAVLNKTKAIAIAATAGSDDMERWANVRVQMQRGETHFQGKRTPCIDFVAPPPRTPSRSKPATPTTKPTSEPPDDDPDNSEGF